MIFSKNELFNLINGQLIAALSQGTIPWRRAWKVGLPANLLSKKIYNGINFLNLCLKEYPSPYYVTYLQCQQKGGTVIKGEKGNWVIFWDVKQVSTDVSNPESKRVPILRKSIIFNLAQTTLFEQLNDERQIVSCEQIISGMNVKPVILNNTLRCMYSPLMDYISLPCLNDFETSEEYYSSLFHELIHWTGHVSRLNRKTINFGENNHSFEELIAEIGSAYLCALTGISPKTLDNQAAYINGWMKLAESGEHIFIKAAIEAQKAVNFITNPLLDNKSNAA